VKGAIETTPRQGCGVLFLASPIDLALETSRSKYGHLYTPVDKSPFKEDNHQLERGRKGWRLKGSISRRFYLLLAIICAVCLLSATTTVSEKLTKFVSEGTRLVTIQNGTLAGIHNTALDQDIFLGIPYAEPPLDSLRFRQSRPYGRQWPKVRNATQYGHTCPQYHIYV